MSNEPAAPADTPLRLPSRRTVVRASAWSTPAVIAAASASPAAAASGSGTLTVDGSASFGALDCVTNAYEFDFLGASIVNTGPAIPANTLQLTVTFVPDSGFPYSLVAFLPGAPSGFVPQASSGIDFSVTYTYAGAVPAGGVVPISDGHWFGAFANRSQQQGTFVLTATAASAAYTSVPFSLHVPNFRNLSINRGTSRGTTVSGCSSVLFETFQIVASTANLSDLRVRTTFQPDPGSSNLLTSFAVPTGWSGAILPITTVLGWTISTAVSITATVPDGTYFRANSTIAQQTGVFELLVTNTGFTSAVWRVRS